MITFPYGVEGLTTVNLTKLFRLVTVVNRMFASRAVNPFCLFACLSDSFNNPSNNYLSWLFEKQQHTLQNTD